MPRPPSLAATALLPLLATPALAQAELEPLDGFTRVEFAAGDETLACMTRGQGTPVLLLHGWPQTADEWKPILPSLAERHTVYACDLPGIRDSTNVDDDFTKAGMAEDIHAAVAAAVPGPVHLVGHDIGMMVGYAYASAYPDDVASLTVIDAFLPGTPLAEQFAADPRLWYHAFHNAPEVPERLVGNDVEYYLTQFIDGFWLSDPRPTAEQIAPYVEAYSDPDTLHGGFEFYRAFARDAEDNAARFATPLPMPVLALSSDLVPFPYVLQMMQPLGTDVRGGVIEGSGHWIAEERPEALVAELTTFLGEVDR